MIDRLSDDVGQPVLLYGLLLRMPTSPRIEEGTLITI